MKLPYNEMKFFPEVKSQTSLSSLRVSSKRALRVSISEIIATRKKSKSKNGRIGFRIAFFL